MLNQLTRCLVGYVGSTEYPPCDGIHWESGVFLSHVFEVFTSTNNTRGAMRVFEGYTHCDARHKQQHLGIRRNLTKCHSPSGPAILRVVGKDLLNLPTIVYAMHWRAPTHAQDTLTSTFVLLNVQTTTCYIMFLTKTTESLCPEHSGRGGLSFR